MEQKNQPFERSSKLSKKEIVFYNFLGGIFWALGATVGLAVIFAIVGFVSKNIDIVPVVGEFVADILDFIAHRNPNL